jgi:hypothetical protein
MNRCRHVTIIMPKWMGFKVSEVPIKCIIQVFVSIPRDQRDQTSHKIQQSAGVSPVVGRWVH